MQQTTLPGTDAGTTDDGAENINQLLQNDEGVDALSGAQVRDVWVRATFAKVLFRNGVWHDDEAYFRQALTQYHAGALKEVAVRAFGRHDEIAQALTFHDERENITALWNRWTKASDELEHDASMTEIAREKLKTMLRGSGMPRMIVARKRVAHHNGGGGA
jgi:hypothetical protein